MYYDLLLIIIFIFVEDNNFGRRASDGGANLQISQNINSTSSEPSSKEDLKKVMFNYMLTYIMNVKIVTKKWKYHLKLH